VEELLVATTQAKCRSAVPALLAALVDVRARPYVADALGALGDERARGPMKAQLAAEPYVTTRPHEARALMALGWHDWAATTPGGSSEVHAGVVSPGGPVRIVALVSDAGATLEASEGGRPLAGNGTGTGEIVRVFDAPDSPRKLRLDLRASSGGVIALWVAPAPRLD
jgi:hypothetical protein